jgi:hypothetical protein
MTSLLKAFSRNRTGWRSSTRTDAGICQQTEGGSKVPFKQTPFFVPQGKDPDLWVAADQRPLQGLSVFVFQCLLTGRKTVLFRRILVSGCANAVFFPVGFLVDHYANWFLQAKVLVPCWKSQKH